MYSNNIVHTAKEIENLLFAIQGNVHTLTLKIGELDFTSNVDSELFSEVPNSGGMSVRRMKNQNEDLYTVLEIHSPAGACGENISTPQQVTLNLVRGKMLYKIGESDWMICTPQENNVFILKPHQTRSYKIMEESVFISIFTPCLPNAKI